MYVVITPMRTPLAQAAISGVQPMAVLAVAAIACAHTRRIQP